MGRDSQPPTSHRERKKEKEKKREVKRFKCHALT